jgi:hypothetical protein
VRMRSVEAALSCWHVGNGPMPPKRMKSLRLSQGLSFLLPYNFLYFSRWRLQFSSKFSISGMARGMFSDQRIRVLLR